MTTEYNVSVNGRVIGTRTSMLGAQALALKAHTDADASGAAEPVVKIIKRTVEGNDVSESEVE